MNKPLPESLLCSSWLTLTPLHSEGSTISENNFVIESVLIQNNEVLVITDENLNVKH